MLIINFALLVAHNLPSGGVVTEREDLDTTRQLRKAGKILGATLMDCVIVGGDEVYSIVKIGRATIVPSVSSV